ncbi:MAG: hypothetical protein RBT15_06870 [Gudongella sp.]|jgi:GNAT superfamily N-acetyltransferase|nr:hypothetical protein [Gudongella sp.]
MNYNILEKIKYYTSLALKKPNLILHFIFQRHLGVILIIPFKSTYNLDWNKKIESIKLTKDVGRIQAFYKKVNRDSVSISQIKYWLELGFDCFLTYDHNEIPIAGMWIFKNEFELHSLSGRTLSSNNLIKLDTDTIYGAYVEVEKNHRGYGINQSMLGHIINYYSRSNKYKRLLLITGASNGAYIRTVMKFNGILVGITLAYNILGFKIRKEIFIDKKEKVWNN